MSRSPPTAPLPIRSVAVMLDAYEVGAVLVRREGTSPGIVSERDVIRAIAAGADLDVVRADDLASGDLLVADLADRVIDVAQRLSDARVRHVAIVDRDEVVGVLSIRDLFAVLLDAAAREHPAKPV